VVIVDITFINIASLYLCLQIRSLVGEMRSKFRDVDALMKVGSATAADRNHDQQLAEVSKMILVMKVLKFLSFFHHVLELNSLLLIADLCCFV